MEKVVKMNEIFDSVFELPIYHELDYDSGIKKAAEKYDVYSGGGCSVICKKIGNKNIVGRNMDLTISNKPAYIVKTAPKNLLKTIGITYFDKFGENAEIIRNNGGIDRDFIKYVPFLCCDILNEKGFYIEVNMRPSEYDEKGHSKFACSGTNPNAKIRVCESMLVRYLADRAESVENALEILKEIDVYSPNGNGLDWNLCFLMADSTGNCGVLEIAKNVISFVKENVQTNFYLTPEFNKLEEYKAGVGRYNFLKENFEAIKDEESMFKTIDCVSYFQMYFEGSKFDPRSELVGDRPGFTTEFLLDDKNSKIVASRFKEIREELLKVIEQGKIQDESKYWKSIFTVVTNCNEKTMLVRFFENNNYITKLKIDF